MVGLTNFFFVVMYSWLLTQIHGGWVAGENSGGCRNDMEAYATNPQYLLELTEPGTYHQHTPSSLIFPIFFLTLFSMGWFV